MAIHVAILFFLLPSSWVIKGVITLNVTSAAKGLSQPPLPATLGPHSSVTAFVKPCNILRWRQLSEHIIAASYGRP